MYLWKMKKIKTKKLNEKDVIKESRQKVKCSWETEKEKRKKAYWRGCDKDK